MTYMYYPGCSLKSSGRSYEESLLAIFRKLDVSTQEIDDWNCCGATAYMAIDEMKAVALAARNLALAEQQHKNGDPQVVAPCAACYMVLTKAKHLIAGEPEIGGTVQRELKNAGLAYAGKIRVRHALDVLVNDVGVEKIKKAVVKSLKGLKVVSYYGCQVVRPYMEFDDPRDPMTMDRLVEATGATAVSWPLKTRCCGGNLTTTISEVGIRLNYNLLKEAERRKADLMVTSCPLCQFNLECYRGEMASMYGDEPRIPVLYFTQLIGMAFGIGEQPLGIQRTLVPSACLKKVVGEEHVYAK